MIAGIQNKIDTIWAPYYFGFSAGDQIYSYCGYFAHRECNPRLEEYSLQYLTSQLINTPLFAISKPKNSWHSYTCFGVGPLCSVGRYWRRSSSKTWDT